MRKLLIASILLILIPCVCLATTPTVTNVTGTVSTGQTLTITGTTMLDEDKTSWGTAYQTGTKYGFEGTSYTADGYADAPDLNPQERGYDSGVKLMGAKSFKGRIYGTSEVNHSCGVYIDLEEDGISDRTDVYVRLYSRWNSVGSGSVWPTSHIKMLDMQGTGGDQMYFQPVAVEGGATFPTQMNMVFDSANHPYSVTNFLQENRWYCMEVRFKTSYRAAFTAWVDGVLLDTGAPSNPCTMTFILFNIINAAGFTNLDLTNWTDNFTVSTSRIYPSTMVEIGNNSDYATATKVSQPLTTISETSTIITADLTGLGAGPYYLWVTNNRQERSSVYNLSGGPVATPSVQGITANGGTLK